jgi:hypothetical protein
MRGLAGLPGGKGVSVTVQAGAMKHVAFVSLPCARVGCFGGRYGAAAAGEGEMREGVDA